MVLRIASVFASLALALHAHAEWNFIPLASSFDVDGMRFPKIVFRESRRHITYVPPPHWRVTGSSARLRLFPGDAADAEATISEIRMETFREVAAENLVHYEGLVRSHLPRLATSIERKETTLHPLDIEGKRTVEFVFDFVLFSRRMCMSCLVLPFENDALLFTLSASPEQFPKLHAEFRRSLYTLEGVSDDVRNNPALPP